MTTIVWHGEYLYCDSQIRILNDVMQSLTKARKLLKPQPINSKAENYEDVIYGYIVTGLMGAGEGLMDTLAKHDGELDKTLKMYDWAQRTHLAQDSFTILLFGGKMLYLLEFKATGVEWRRETFGTSLAFGTGGPPAMDEIRKGATPIKGMYKSFLKDPDNNGGIIDVWKHHPDKGIFFERYGIRNAVPDAEIPDLLVDMKAPVALDLYSPIALREMLPTEMWESLGKTEDKAESSPEKKHMGRPKRNLPGFKSSAEVWFDDSVKPSVVYVRCVTLNEKTQEMSASWWHPDGTPAHPQKNQLRMAGKPRAS